MSEYRVGVKVHEHSGPVRPFASCRGLCLVDLVRVWCIYLILCMFYGGNSGSVLLGMHCFSVTEGCTVSPPTSRTWFQRQL